MGTNDKYFQFELSALAFGSDSIERLRHVVDLCVVRAGKGQAAQMNKKELREAAEELSRGKWPGGVSVTRADHLAVVAGMDMLNVQGGSVTHTLDQAQTLEAFIRTQAGEEGRSPFVRMRHDLIWDCINGGMRYREFSLLAAVYCQLGASAFRRITRAQIQAGAMGYKSPKLLTEETLSERADGQRPLTIDQIRYSLDALEGRSLFARVQLSPRRTYFSHRLSRDELSAKLAEWEIRRQTKTKTHRQADKALRERIRQACIVVGKPSQQSPHSPRTVPTQSPNSPREIPTTIETLP